MTLMVWIIKVKYRLRKYKNVDKNNRKENSQRNSQDYHVSDKELIKSNDIH